MANRNSASAQEKGPGCSSRGLLGRRIVTKLQLACRRRKAGISRWSSPCGAGGNRCRAAMDVQTLRRRALCILGYRILIRHLLGDGTLRLAIGTAAPSQARRRGPRSAARSLRRGGRGRHWRAAATATAWTSADALPRRRRGPAGFRPAPASGDPRTSASAGRGAGARSAACGMKVSGVAGCSGSTRAASL